VKPIDEALIEVVCGEVAELDASTLAAQMEALGQSQPNLLAFVIANCESLSSETAELGVYVFFVAYKIFERAAGVRLREVAGNLLSAAEERTEELLDAAEDAADGLFESVVEAEFSIQPEIIRTVAEILETYGEEGETKLAEEEKWLLFLVLITVVDVLDSAS